MIWEGGQDRGLSIRERLEIDASLAEAGEAEHRKRLELLSLTGAPAVWPVLNLTQHAATSEQVAAGVIDLTGEKLATVRDWLTFDEPPREALIEARASALAQAASREPVGGDYVRGRRYPYAMIGGAPYLMGPLERALQARGVHALYAFSRRESVEQEQPDGSVRKINVFRHLGFVEAGS